MSNRFPCACPRARQICGKKTWRGYAGGFAFPGFKANWVDPLFGGPGWQFTADGGAITGSAANFAVGDLVVREMPATGATDYLTGIAQSYPKYYNAYICTTAIIGSATDPFVDTTHFQPWNLLEGRGGDTIYSETLGPDGWPFSTGSRLLDATTTTSAYTEVTITTELVNFPLYPASLSGLTAKLGTRNDTTAAYDKSTDQQTAAAGAFAYDWTLPTASYGGATGVLDAATAAYTPAGPAPSSVQSLLLFPSVPSQRVTNYAPIYDGSGNITSVFQDGGIGWTQSTSPYPGIVSWSFSATSISFEFAAWSWNSDVEYNAYLGIFGALATAPGTIIQTITLSGPAYTLAAVATQAEALMNATSFTSIAWGTSLTNTYGPTGALVSTPSTPSTASTAITEAGQVGTPVPWAVAVNGCPFDPGDDTYFATQAQVDICGNYCTRTYAYGASGPISCANGNINGYAPFVLSPPATPAQSIAAYNASQCS